MREHSYKKLVMENAHKAVVTKTPELFILQVPHKIGNVVVFVVRVKFMKYTYYKLHLHKSTYHNVFKKDNPKSANRSVQVH